MSKIMCGWLPKSHTQSPMTGVNGCPGCRYQKKTLYHLLQCPNKEAGEMRRAALTAFKAEDKNKKIPLSVMEIIHNLLTKYMQEIEGEVAVSGSSALELATSQQNTIALKLLPQGFIAKGWKDAMKEGVMKD